MLNCTSTFWGAAVAVAVAITAGDEVDVPGEPPQPEIKNANIAQSAKAETA
jgi:hypothetical protein